MKEYTITKNQKDRSMTINKYRFETEGGEGTHQYNKLSILLHTGHTSDELREIANASSVKYRSVKDIIRQLDPEMASAMALTDDMMVGRPMKDLYRIAEVNSQHAKAIFEEMAK